LCDVDQARLDAVGSGTPNKPKLLRKHRDLLALPEVEVVAIATPDHWHTLMTLDALAAGKHVYLEPPVCRSFGECQALVRAAERSQRIIQVATMGRANAAVAAITRAVGMGRFGEITGVESWSNPTTEPAEDCAAETPPPELDWNLWLGPAAETRYCPQLHAGEWCHHLELGGGFIACVCPITSPSCRG
jgi:predicted dehydrogenase